MSGCVSWTLWLCSWESAGHPSHPLPLRSASKSLCQLSTVQSATLSSSSTLVSDSPLVSGGTSHTAGTEQPLVLPWVLLPGHSLGCWTIPALWLLFSSGLPIRGRSTPGPFRKALCLCRSGCCACPCWRLSAGCPGRWWWCQRTRRGPVWLVGSGSSVAALVSRSSEHRPWPVRSGPG